MSHRVKRMWCSGNIKPFQGFARSSILRMRKYPFPFFFFFFSPQFFFWRVCFFFSFLLVVERRGISRGDKRVLFRANRHQVSGIFYGSLILVTDRTDRTDRTDHDLLLHHLAPIHHNISSSVFCRCEMLCIHRLHL